jgi:hypothetical protein
LNFAEIIRSNRAVRGAFDKVTTHRWWWKGILALHGKPHRDDLTPDERKQILSNGFRFYARLYTLLALVMAVLSALLFLFPITEGFYWPGIAMFASVYLGASSVLAFKGARRYLHDTTACSALLIVFFVAVIGFLMFFCGALWIIINQHQPQLGVASLILLVLFVMFGVGSYLIEILYLFYNGAEDGEPALK